MSSSPDTWDELIGSASYSLPGRELVLAAGIGSASAGGAVKGAAFGGFSCTAGCGGTLTTVA